MKKAVAVFAIAMIALAGCSKGSSKSDEEQGKGAADAHASPKAIVEAMFAEGQKEELDRDAIRKLMSEAMQKEISKDEDFKFFAGMMKKTKLSKIEDVTTHESGNYAKVHVVLTSNGKDDKEEIPTVKVDGKWYIHNRYGEKSVGKSTSVKSMSKSE